MELSEFLQAELNKRKVRLQELYDAQVNAGLATVGDIDNRIKEMYRQIDEIKKKITSIENNDKSSSSLFVYIITGTNKRVRDALGESLYCEANPLNHDDEDCKKWRPFLKEDCNIANLIHRFKSCYGFNFIEYYLEGIPAVEEILVMDENLKNIIAIVDLLTLDAENEQTARRFNTTSVYRLIIPFCAYLPNKLKDYMRDKREKVFDLVHYGVSCSNRDYDFFYPDTSQEQALFVVLKKAFNEKRNIFNIITDRSSSMNNQYRSGLNNPSF